LFFLIFINHCRTNVNIEPLGNIFLKYSSLKPLSHSKTNLFVMFLVWFSTKCLFRNQLNIQYLLVMYLCNKLTKMFSSCIVYRYKIINTCWENIWINFYLCNNSYNSIKSTVLYFNLHSSINLDSLSCSFTSISFLTKRKWQIVFSNFHQSY
jgi:hypothetical protein